MGDPYASLRTTWNELEDLVRRAGDQGVGSLSFEQTERLGATYRLVTAHLARLRQEARDPEIVQYLNDLAIRAHGVIYRPTRDRLDPLGFFVRRFPRTFRDTGRYQAIAAGLMLAAAIVAFGAVQVDRELAYTLVPPGLYPRDSLHTLILDPHAQDVLLTHGRDQGVGEKAAFASFLMTNNTRVGLLAFVTGVIAMVPTVFLILYNGLMLGAFASVFFGDGGFHPLFLAWLLPHGITELLAINICSAAGLYIGMGVIDPGRLPRRDAIRLRAQVALRLALGTIPMFVAAGLIESFLRQSSWPPLPRLAFAAATVALWIAYLGFAGRKEKSHA
jgi:uncharacterized membrane protein SpoIIM required for sporulation